MTNSFQTMTQNTFRHVQNIINFQVELIEKYQLENLRTVKRMSINMRDFLAQLPNCDSEILVKLWYNEYKHSFNVKNDEALLYMQRKMGVKCQQVDQRFTDILGRY